MLLFFLVKIAYDDIAKFNESPKSIKRLLFLHFGNESLGYRNRSTPRINHDGHSSPDCI